jgi:hypothetical protein
MNKKLFSKLKFQYPSFSDASIEKIYLFKKLYAKRITALEFVRLSFLIGMITEAQYLDYFRIGSF